MPLDRSFELEAERRFDDTVVVVLIGCPLVPGCPLAPGCRTYPLLKAEERIFELEADARSFALEAE